MDEAFTLVASVQAKAGDEPEVEAAIRRCVAATRQEAGCLSYVAHDDLDVAGRFVFIERWASRSAHAYHVKEPHFLALVAALEGKTVGGFTVSFLRPLD